MDGGINQVVLGTSQRVSLAVEHIEGPFPRFTGGFIETVPREELNEAIEALMSAYRALEENDKWHDKYDEHEGYPDSELCETNAAALSKARLVLVIKQEKPI